MTQYNLNNLPVICIMGPTACGKTQLAFDLVDAGKANYQIISVDSALIYQDMNIGTAKPTPNELAQYPHALVDIITPEQSYSAADFVADTKKLITTAHAQGRIPLLVGGTMLYFSALIHGLSNLPTSNEQIRKQVQKFIAEQGIQAAHATLAQVDKPTAARLSANDTQRVSRALEVFYQTGKPISVWQDQPQQQLADNWQVVSLMPDRQWLHERIAKRLDIMWQQGLVDEVIGLRKKYQLNENLSSMRCVGYRQVWQYLDKLKQQTDERPTEIHLITRQEMYDKALYATRQLAKRQYTWLRKLQKLNSHHRFNTFATIKEAKKNVLFI